MPIDVSLTFAGNQVKFHQAIPVQSFSWSAENEVAVGSATGGAGAGKAKLMEAVLTKQVDELASPLLFQLLMTGGHLDNVTLEFRKPGPGIQTSPAEKPWITIELAEVFVSQLSQSVSTGNESLTEEIHLAYGAVNMTINGMDAQGAVTSGTPVGWSQITNQPAQPAQPVPL